MAKRPILILPDLRLRAIADPIVEIDDGRGQTVAKPQDQTGVVIELRRHLHAFATGIEVDENRAFFEQALNHHALVGQCDPGAALELVQRAPLGLLEACRDLERVILSDAEENDVRLLRK